MTTTPTITAVEERDGLTELQRRANAVIEVARRMPRRTPKIGGCGTVHAFNIEAGTVWELDRALVEYDMAVLAAPQPPETAGETVAWRDVSLAPQTGTSILLKHKYHGVVEGYFSKGEWSEETPNGPREYSGDVWVLGDDLAQEEVEFGEHGELLSGSVTGWLPLSVLCAPTKQAAVSDGVGWQSITQDTDATSPLWAAIRTHYKGGPLYWSVHLICCDDETGEMLEGYDHGWRLEDYEFWMPANVPPAPTTQERGEG